MKWIRFVLSLRLRREVEIKIDWRTRTYWLHRDAGNRVCAFGNQRLRYDRISGRLWKLTKHKKWKTA